MSSTDLRETRNNSNDFLIIARDTTVKVVKRNPIKVSAYLIGILLFMFANGYKITPEVFNTFNSKLDELDDLRPQLMDINNEIYEHNHNYKLTKGWFSCNLQCQQHYKLLQQSQNKLSKFKQIEKIKLQDAKSVVGLFSEYGISETRSLFWEKFSHGKEFSSRQTKWDAMFITFTAMSRDESIMNYALRIVTQFIFNFTVGVFLALVYFMFSLYTLIQSYRPSLLEILVFFSFAMMSAIAFCLTWLAIFYSAIAGSVYVGAKLLATTVRIEDGSGSGSGGRQGGRRVRNTY